jgi:hypothetical protein
MFENVAAKRIVRVPQPRCLRIIKGTPPDWHHTGGAANRGRLFLDCFLLATQKKAISSRSATGKIVIILVTDVTQ